MVGLEFLITPIGEVGTVINVREDDRGEKLIDLKTASGEFYVTRMCELTPIVML